MAATVTQPPIDLLSPAFYGDLDGMHEAFTWMRANDPLHRCEHSGFVAVTRHADVLDVEHRDDVFSSNASYRSVQNPGEDNMIAQDDPQHLAQRRLVSRRFTPKAVRDLEPVLSRMIGGLLTSIVADVAPGERGSMEAVTAVAAALPAQLTAHLLGFPEEIWPDIKSWSERLMRYDAVHHDGAALNGFLAAIGEFVEVLHATAAERRACPADDLITVWVQGEANGCPMDDSKLVNETGLVISGGAETTRTVIARSLVAFADHPDQWEAMHDDPSLIPGAVEEMIRWVTPLNNMFRVATADTTVAGVPIRAGDRMALLYPSANRDEAVFDDPFSFDIRRHPNPQIAFGFGTHFCLGASLARVELRLLMERLVATITDLEVLAPPDIEPNIFVGAVRSLELGFRRRPQPVL
jgi:cytochrome P450 family 142 subfamily A polypeptide 1